MLLSAPRVPDDAAAMRSARQDFVRQMLMRLPRTLAGVTLSQHVTNDGGQERLAIDASGPDGVWATLLADSGSCVPVALQYAFPGGLSLRVELSAYREFGGLRFPTVLKTLQDGVPFAEEHVSSIVLNAPGADRYFAPGR